MLKSLFKEDSLETVLGEIIAEMHEKGPINSLSLEKLSYIKKFQPVLFEKYEEKIVSLMGLFYKEGNNKNSFIQEIYDIYASSISDETGHWFSAVQASAFKLIKNNQYFSFSAPTSSGKSFLFRALIEEAKGDIVIVVPSRALISEYYSRIIRLMDNKKEVLVLQFIDNVNKLMTERRVFIITPERGVELFKRAKEFSIELFLLDEAQISEDAQRGLRFDSFVRRIKKEFPLAKKVFAHPFVANPEAQLLKHDISLNSSHKNYE